MTKVTRQSGALSPSARRLLEGQGRIDRDKAAELIKSAPAGELQTLLEQHADRFESDARAAVEGHLAAPLAAPGERAEGQSTALGLMMSERRSNDSAWWSSCPSSGEQLFPDAPTASVNVGGELFTAAETEAMLGSIGAAASVSMEGRYVDFGGPRADPFLSLDVLAQALAAAAAED